MTALLKGFHINIDTCRAFWQTNSASNSSRLRKTFPLHVSSDGGLMFLCAPLGTDDFLRAHLFSKVHSRHAPLNLLDSIPDACIRFHLHCVTGSVCQVEHFLRLNPPLLSLCASTTFDKLQLETYSSLNDGPISSDMATHFGFPLHLDGHGFTSLTPFLYTF